MQLRRKNSLRLESLEARETPATLYVSPAGSDANPGTAAAPLLTLQTAANRVAAGDTVNVAAGTYRGFNLTADGTAAARITFHAEPGVVIDRPNPWNNLDGINLEGASFVTVEGFTVTGMPRAGIRSVTNEFVVIRDNVADANAVWGIFTGFSSDLLIEGNRASNSAQQHGIYVSNSADRPVVRGNTVVGNHGSGIQLNADVFAGGDGVITGALIEDNVIRANGAGGGASINLDGVQDSVVRNNVIDGARSTGIALFRQNGAAGSSNNRVVNNTVVVDNGLDVTAGRWAVSISGGSTGNVLTNNILYSTQSFRGAVSVSADSLAGLVSDYNAAEDRFSLDGGGSALGLAAWRAATGQDAHSLVLVDVAALNALFVDRAAGDYHLHALSAAVDRGTASGAPAADFEGTPRPSGAGIDIGADEFAEPLPPPPTSPPPPPPPPSPPPADPVNTAPTISPIGDVTIAFNGTSGPIAFTVGDAETPAGSLVVTVSSSNNQLLPPEGLVLGGSGSDRTLGITPARKKFGTAVVTVTVTDAGGLSTSVSFTVTVTKPHRK
jgi:parallel beta-helix repeat protein